MVLSTKIKPLQGSKGDRIKIKIKWLQLFKVIPIHHIEVNAKDD